MYDYQAEILMPNTDSRGQYLVINSLSSLFTPISDIANDDNLASMIDKKIQLSDLQSSNVNSKQVKAVYALALAKQWVIPSERSKNASYKKTQCGILTVMNPHMSQRYPNNDRILRYPRLPHPVFTDTMIAGTVSNSGNKNSQVYGTLSGWTRLFPNKLNNDAHEIL